MENRQVAVAGVVIDKTRRRVACRHGAAKWSRPPAPLVGVLDASADRLLLLGWDALGVERVELHAIARR